MNRFQFSLPRLPRIVMIPISVLIGMGVGTPAHAETAQGRLDWENRVELATTVSGVVKDIKVRVGERVKRGDALVVLDSREFHARLKAAKGRVTGAKPAFEEAQRESERALDLYDRTVLSDHELQKAQIGLAQAEAELERAEAARTLAGIDLERASVRAPFDALVLHVSAVPGQVVLNRLQATPLVTVADAGHMAVRLVVSTQVVGSLRVGQSVNVSAAGKQYPGEITEVAMESASQGGFPISVRFATGGDLLRAGGTVSVDLP
ncbi:MAG: efflux RND transporter periplasmic adaptor subunit [Gammaproteobacteria bacterium]